MTIHHSWSPFSKLAKFAVLWIILLITYLSLFPITEWRSDSLTGLNNEELINLAIKTIFNFPKYWTKFDIITNILAYIPLGAFIFWSLSHTTHLLKNKNSNTICFTLAVFLSMLLSITLEGLQFFLPSRIPSVLDVIANTSGAFCGGLWAWLKHKKHSYLMPWWRSDHSFGYILIFLWFLAQLIEQPTGRISHTHQAIYLPGIPNFISEFLASKFSIFENLKELKNFKLLNIIYTIGHLLLPCLLILGQLNWSEHLHTPRIRPFLLFIFSLFILHIYHFESLNNLEILENPQLDLFNLMQKWRGNLESMNYNIGTISLTFASYLILATLPSRLYGRILFVIWTLLVLLKHYLQFHDGFIVTDVIALTHPAWHPFYELLHVIYEHWFLPFLLYVVLYTIYYNNDNNNENNENNK